MVKGTLAWQLADLISSAVLTNIASWLPDFEHVLLSLSVLI